MTTDTEESKFSLRSMKCELNQLSMPDGSAMLMQGDTAVVAGIYGPVESKIQKMLYDRACIDVTYSPTKGPAKVDDRLIELYIKETCAAAIIVTLHPGAAVCINVQELQDVGGLLACALNAACLALINSGLSMKFTIAAVSCAIDKTTGDIVLDPSSLELQDARAEFTFAFDSVKRDIICCHTTGCFSEEEFFNCIAKCKEASQYVFDFYREIVRKYANVI